MLLNREAYSTLCALTSCLSCSDVHLIPFSLTFRSCSSSLTGLDLPGDSQELVQELALDMRTNCMFIMLNQAINGK